MGDQHKEERKVPVFTVFKKDSILKNIFLDAPQTNEAPNSTTNQEDEDEQVIVIGRHPDCSITLDHPSISRFHLRLHSKPSSQTLSLVDLSSVHGTWVSGKKVEPGVQVDLNEGDIVQLGGSSRRYMLHWVPMSLAYNLDVPFVPPMDVLMTVKETEELSNQDDNCCSSFETNQIQSQCKSLGDLGSSFSKEEMTVSPLAPTMPELGHTLCNNEEAKKEGNLSGEQRQQNEISGICYGKPLKEELTEEIKNWHSDEDSENSPNASSPSNDQNKDLFAEEHEENEIPGFSSGTPLKEEKLIEELKNQHSDKDWENLPNASSIGNNHNKDLFREEHEENKISGFSSGTPLKEELIAEIKNQHSDKDWENAPNSISPSNDHIKGLFREEHEEDEISGFSIGTPLKEEELSEEIKNQHSDKDSKSLLNANTPSNDHNQDLFREEHEDDEISGFFIGTPLKEDELTEEIKNQHSDKDSKSSLNANSPSNDHNKDLFREEHKENEISGFFSGTLLKEELIAKIKNRHSDKDWENSLIVGTPSNDHIMDVFREEHEQDEELIGEIKNQHSDEDGENSPIASSPSNGHNVDLFREEHEEDEELIEEIKNQHSDEDGENSLTASSPSDDHKEDLFRKDAYSEELIFSSDKENHTPKILQKSRLVQSASKNSAKLNVQPATENGISRIPFKSLLSNSASKSCSDGTILSSNSGKYAQPIEKNAVAGDNKRWIMVADTNCLLNKVSRKALQLLQGVKGTRLVIPRVVIRELECMKQRSYLFTRTEILSALQWIENCMVNTNWWIHVESLMEGGRHLTPAPSLSISEGEIKDFAFSLAPFSAFPNFLEIVSLMPGDHILECALLNRRMKNDENLVILSADVSLKIKAMAEGIICEAAEEFRESLVNPFSDRFLWAKSSPRGLTWSCVDDIVLREKYCRGPSKKPGDILKGLKLILVQNSHLSELLPNSTEMNCFKLQFARTRTELSAC